MNKSDLFSYLSAFVTIVLAVALGDMIQSVHRLIRARARVRWDWLPLIFAALVAAVIVSEFFSLWEAFNEAQISFPRLLWILTVPTVFALLAYSALPDEVPADGLDLTKFYAEERQTWVVIFGLAVVLDLSRSALLIGHNRDWLIQFAKYATPMLLVSIVAFSIIWTGRSRRWDIAGVLLLAAVSIYGMIGWKISVKS